MKLSTVAGVAAFLLLSGYAGAAAPHEIKFGDLVISHPWARQSPASAQVAAGFLTVTNNGAADDRLVKATAEIAPVVQLHDMKMVGEVMKMVELPEGIPIPAGATVALKPKSLHIMFMDVKTQPMAGVMFRGSLTFEKAGTVEVEFEVKDASAGTH